MCIYVVFCGVVCCVALFCVVVQFVLFHSVLCVVA